MRKTVIIGATSAIAEETARLLADQGDTLLLVARNQQRLEAVSSDLRVRSGTQVETLVADVNDYHRHEEIISTATQQLGGLDVLLIAHGTLPDQSACQQSFDETRRELETNALSVISLLTLAAEHFEAQRSGTIAAISSVAGDRGRKNNYIYGSAKGMVSLFMQGLRNRLHAAGVQVLTIKPGFVDTPMTEAFDKGLLWASPQRVAHDINRAIGRGCDIIYTPWFWRYIMLIIRLTPERLFKRLSL